MRRLQRVLVVMVIALALVAPAVAFVQAAPAPASPQGQQICSGADRVAGRNPTEWTASFRQGYTKRIADSQLCRDFWRTQLGLPAEAGVDQVQSAIQGGVFVVGVRNMSPGENVLNTLWSLQQREIMQYPYRARAGDREITVAIPARKRVLSLKENCGNPLSRKPGKKVSPAPAQEVTEQEVRQKFGSTYNITYNVDQDTEDSFNTCTAEGDGNYICNNIQIIINNICVNNSCNVYPPQPEQAQPAPPVRGQQLDVEVRGKDVSSGLEARPVITQVGVGSVAARTSSTVVDPLPGTFTGTVDVWVDYKNARVVTRDGREVPVRISEGRAVAGAALFRVRSSSACSSGFEWEFVGSVSPERDDGTRVWFKADVTANTRLVVELRSVPGYVPTFRSFCVTQRRARLFSSTP